MQNPPVNNNFPPYNEIDSVKYREKIKQLYLDFSLFEKTEITNFCICIIFKDNTKYFLSNMPEWAIQWHKLGGSRADEVFNLETMKNKNFFIPKLSQYDQIQQSLVDKEEIEFRYFDIYSLIRRHIDCSFILLALNNHEIIDPQNIYYNTYAIFEDFCIYFLSSMIDEIKLKNSQCKNLSIFSNNILLKSVIKDGLIKEMLITDRERECVQLIKINYPPKLIARTMNISEKTVRNYIESIKIKLDCNSIFEIYEKSIQYDL